MVDLSLVSVIQGTLDLADKEVPQQEIKQTLEFCTNLFDTSWDEKAAATALKKADEAQKDSQSSDGLVAEKLQSILTQDEQIAFNHIELSKKMRVGDTIIMAKTFTSDVVEGRKLRLERGKLGLELVQGPAPLAA